MTAPMQPTLARRQLRLAAVGALAPLQTSAVIATLDSPGDWSTPPEKLPAVLLRTGRGRRDSINKGMVEFNSAVILEIEGRIEAASATAAQDAIEALGYMVENALFTDYNVIGMVQQVASVDEEYEITSEGKRHLGGFKMAITFEMVEMFDPTAAPPALTAWPVVQPATVGLTNIQLHADLAKPFDATATYANPPFPGSVTAAPRTSGPDGRDEGGLNITLPQ